MPRRPVARQADIARAVKGTMSAGLKVSRVEIEPDGRIRVIVAVSDEPAGELEHELDAELRAFEVRHGQG